jgi:hypothetical protein
METLFLDNKDNTINNQNDKVEPFSLNINDSFIKNNNIFNDNILMKDNHGINGVIDKEFNSFNFLQYLEEDEDQKIIKDSLRSERDTLSNSKKIISNDLNKIKGINDDEIKRQLKLKRNRESAKNGRLRKKEFIQRLINENNYLKNKYQNLLSIIYKCPECKKIFEKNEGKSHMLNYECENNILRDETKCSNKRKFLFATIIAVISIINIFNIPLSVINYYNTFYNGKFEYLRNLNNFEEGYKKEGNNFIINKLTTSNGDKEALYIHLAEFYSLTQRKKIENQNQLNEEINKNIQIFHENQINIDQMTQTNATQCVKCVVEINKNSVKMGGDEFTFYLADRYLSSYFGNTSAEGIFPKMKSKTFSKIFALKCKIIAYSINDIFSEKI